MSAMSGIPTPTRGNCQVHLRNKRGKVPLNPRIPLAAFVDALELIERHTQGAA
jgi:hypothetical protein